ncbi:MAG: hypothetical protein Q4G26_02895 [Paracoccus sp. (in: a-proteobacteria)]|nr:hypothetical protein [Paracoccus sp. (in: a-proteobacteria)]
MKIYIIIATILSTLFGIMPLYLGKISGMDAAACDTDTWFETGECVIFPGRGLLLFSYYFLIAAVFFTVLLICLTAVISIFKREQP